MMSQETRQLDRPKTHTTRFLGWALLVMLLSAACVTPLFAQETKTVTLAAGSVDGLAAAIAEAGPGGRVIIESGLHRESGSVLIKSPVSLIGEPNAIIESTTPTDPNGGRPTVITAALHIQGTRDVSVDRLWFRPPADSLSSTAILIEDSPKVIIRNNKITDHEYGIIIQRGDHAEIIGNRIQNMDTHGIVVINGQHTRIVGNEIKESGAFGIWACDYDGECLYNTLSQNFIGIVLCRVNEGSFEISGKLDGANSSANGWRVALNESTDSFIGYAVDDGAFENYLFGNGASGNDLYDIDFWFDTHDNVLVQGPVNDPLLIHLCGTNNVSKGDFTLSDDSCDM